jgi:hypothetical protein
VCDTVRLVQRESAIAAALSAATQQLDAVATEIQLVSTS